MATVSGTFTADGVSSTLRLGRAAEEVDYVITGPIDGTLQLERAQTPDETSWRVVAGPFTTAAAGRYRGRMRDRLRMRAVSVSALTVTNGDFAAGTGWTAGAGWAIAAGVATRTASASTPNLDTTIAAGLVEGASYTVTFDITTSAGSLTVSLGGGAASDAISDVDDTVSVTLVAGATAVLRFIAAADYDGTIDNVTITPTIAYTFADGDAILSEVRDPDGNVLETVTQAGRTFHGNLTVEGTSTFDGLPMVKRGLTALSLLDLQALANTPIEVIAAPGAGKFIQVLGWRFRLIFGSAAIDDAAADGNLILKYAGGSTIDVMEADGLVDAAATTQGLSGNLTELIVAETGIDNTAVQISNDAAEFTIVGSGDGTAEVEVFYRILDTNPA
jgi:hypothetical protein